MGCTSGKSKKTAQTTQKQGEEKPAEPSNKVVGNVNLQQLSMSFNDKLQALTDKSQLEKFLNMSQTGDIIDQYRVLQLINTSDKFKMAQQLYDETTKFVCNVSSQEVKLADLQETLLSNFGNNEFTRAVEILKGKQISIADQCLFVIHSTYHAIQLIVQDKMDPQRKYWFTSKDKVIQQLNKLKQDLLDDIPELAFEGNQPAGNQQLSQDLAKQYLTELYHASLNQNLNGLASAQEKDTTKQPPTIQVCKEVIEKNQQLISLGEKFKNLDDEVIVEDENEHEAKKTQNYKMETQFKSHL